ncbi:phytanoyl-CoA dioxygenase family protein [Streptomyces sp. NPDC050560]|uniref:phytanoyl-CoA dioxygenase family protein n=1 Tax=Streptomyces sp. NPDC050560 TaxID=3365630 RepID=UPI00378F512A
MSLFSVDSGAVAARREQFSRSGFLVLSGLLPTPLRERVMREVDHWVDDGLRARSIAACVGPEPAQAPPVLELELPAHGELLTHQPLLEVVEGLLGAPFVFHHLHSDRHGPGTAGKPWHHDYEPNDSGDRGLHMVHALHYISGLDGTVGNLTLLPGSHHEPRGKSALAHLGTARQPGEIVVDSLPPGSTVLINSALLHARRPVPGTGEPGSARYFVDASYCQTGARWRPVKPYWRHMLARARDLGLGGGRWPELFAERHFTEYARSA